MSDPAEAVAIDATDLPRLRLRAVRPAGAAAPRTTAVSVGGLESCGRVRNGSSPSTPRSTNTAGTPPRSGPLRKQAASAPTCRPWNSGHGDRTGDQPGHRIPVTEGTAVRDRARVRHRSRGRGDHRRHHTHPAAPSPPLSCRHGLWSAGSSRDQQRTDVTLSAQRTSRTALPGTRRAATSAAAHAVCVHSVRSAICGFSSPRAVSAASQVRSGPSPAASSGRK